MAKPKIRISERKAQARLRFSEREYLRRSQRYEKLKKNTVTNAGYVVSIVKICTFVFIRGQNLPCEEMRGLIYIVVLFIITGCSCSSSMKRELEDAQRLMASDPQVALSRLNRLDVSEFNDSATMARWALLYSEAMLANNLAAPTDTIINIAFDYYGAHNLRSEFQRASRVKALSQTANKANELATALYLQKEKEYVLFKERATRQQIVYISLIVLLIAVGVIVWMRQRLKVRSAQNDALMSEASILNKQILLKEDDVSRLQATLQGLLENRFALIDSLCQTYYETQGTKTERKAIAEKVKNEIEAVRTESFAEMEKVVNDCRGNIINRIKSTLPDIKQEDYQLAVFLASNLSTRTISLLLGESVEVVYKRKSRLKKRLLSADSAKNADFAMIF